MANPSSIKNKQFKYFVGIDVSSKELDFAVMQGKDFLFHREINNEPPDIVLLIRDLKLMQGFSITKALFCMEDTGFYGNHLLNYLKKLKAHVAVENPLKIKNSIGLARGKHDKADAIRIAKYASNHSGELKLWQPKRAIIQQLASLMTLRTRLLNVKNILKVPLKEQTTFMNKAITSRSDALCNRSLTALQSDFEEIDKVMDLLIASDIHLSHIYTLITSVPCIGRITAIMVITATNEFHDIRDPKQFACYAGVAPFRNESGLVKHKSKISSIGNKKMKGLLHTCAMIAVRYNGELRDYYIRKTTKEGKPKMAAINAVRNKLIHRIFACLNQDRPFQKEYTRQLKVSNSISIAENA